MPNLSTLRDFWRGLEGRAQATLVGSLLAVMVTMFGIYHFASQPSYTTIQTGLDPSTSNRMAQALGSAGIGYQIENGGTAIAVKSGAESKAQAALGSAGLGAGAHTDMSIFNSSSLTTTDFQNQVNYQRALEGQIAETIEGMQGVSSAEVQLVLPKDQLFQDQASQSTAAIVIDAPAGLDQSSITGIAHMVASSVQGLDPSNVTITDQSGDLLWPSGSGGTGGAPTKLQEEQAYGAQVSSQIDAYLTSILGPGKADARVNADLNVDQTSQSSVTYDKKSVVPLSSTSSNETLKSNGSTAGGVAGTAGNIPGYTGGTANGGTSQYQNKQSSTQNGVNKTVTQTQVAPGAINHENVALLLDKSVPASEVAAIKTAVSNMVGLTPSRGDTLSVSQLSFAKPSAFSPSSGGLPIVGGSPIGVAKTAVIGLAAIVFFFLARRNLRKKEGEAVAPEPKWLREIQQTMPIAQLTPAVPDPMTDRRRQMQSTAEEIVKNQPEQVAMQVAQWMSE
jgi:flagellar M-ring protein FliF